MNAKIDISNVVLKTDRLTLRAWTYKDIDDFYEYASVDGVGQMAGWLPHQNKEESMRILSHFIEGKHTFALVYNGKAIGSLGLEEYSDNEFDDPSFKDKFGREIGFVLSKDYWGQGLMPEAVKRVIEYCFKDLKLDFLLCGHFVSNTQSKRVQEKCGFKEIKHIKYKTKYNTLEDCVLAIIENN